MIYLPAEYPKLIYFTSVLEHCNFTNGVIEMFLALLFMCSSKFQTKISPAPTRFVAMKQTQI